MFRDIKTNEQWRAQHVRVPTSPFTRYCALVNAFEPYIYRLHKDYKEEKFIDWPTIVLAKTVQATAISLFRLLPPLDEYSNEVLDQRSIASLIRNIVDTHDVLRMLARSDSEERFSINRDILAFYLSSRISKVQTSIDPANAETFPKYAKDHYWQRIKSSPLYTDNMARLKDGETIFYESRIDRVNAVCGEHTDFVLGVLADLSAHVHSVPPPIWFSDLDDIYSDNKRNRDMIGVWLRIANFYIARCGYEKSSDLAKFLDQHAGVFSHREDLPAHCIRDGEVQARRES